jgi:pyruvate carboxylase
VYWPPGGFPKALQKRVLRGRRPLRGRPGATLPLADFDADRQQLEKQLHRHVTDQEVVTHLLYARVFTDFAAHQRKYSDTSVLPTPVFFHGLAAGEEVSIDIEQGKTLIIRYLTVSDPHPDGTRTVFFELNGQPREVIVADKSLTAQVRKRPKAEAGNLLHVAAPMPGLVVSVVVSEGEAVAKGQKLCTMEAMKMETTVYAEQAGRVAEVLVKPGTQVEGGDLLIRLEG